MISPQPGMGVSPKISSVHTDFLPPYPFHHNILSLRLETDRQRWFQSSQNYLSSSCGGLKKYFSKYFSEVFLMWNMLNLLSPLSTSWPCPLKPGRARPLYSHQSIIWHQPQVVTQFQDGHIFRTVRSQVMSHTDVTCGGGLLPLVWAQAGLLVSWLPQLTRHTGAGRGQRSS